MQRRTPALPSDDLGADAPQHAGGVEILIVEDDPKLAGLLQQELRHEGYAPTVVNTGGEALLAAEEGGAELILLDLNLPDFDGLEVAERLQGRVEADILMLTARGDVADRVAGLYAGARDYLVKPFSIQELLARVHASLRGRRRTRCVRYRNVAVDRDAGTCRVDGETVTLSSYEFELLALLLDNQGRVFSKELLETRLYGGALPTSNTVEVFVSRLRVKLREAGAPEVIRTVRGAGYVVA